jgi:hypothetical protein
VSEPAAIIKGMPVYELWIKRAAHLDPEEHIFDSGRRDYSLYDVLDFYGERLRVVDHHRQTLVDASDGPHAVQRLTCVPA